MPAERRGASVVSGGRGPASTRPARSSRLTGAERTLGPPAQPLRGPARSVRRGHPGKIWGAASGTEPGARPGTRTGTGPAPRIAACSSPHPWRFPFAFAIPRAWVEAEGPITPPLPTSSAPAYLLRPSRDGTFPATASPPAAHSEADRACPREVGGRGAAERSRSKVRGVEATGPGAEGGGRWTAGGGLLPPRPRRVAVRVRSERRRVGGGGRRVDRGVDERRRGRGGPCLFEMNPEKAERDLYLILDRTERIGTIAPGDRDGCRTRGHRCGRGLDRRRDRFGPG